MALDPSSYGALDDVAALVPRYATPAGVFDATTRPKLTQVEKLMDQVSSIVNAYLGQEGFTIPVAAANAKRSLDFFVAEEVASLCEGINGSGRFGPTAKSPGKGRFAVIMTEVKDFLKGNAAGLVQQGALRSTPEASRMAFRDVDERGRATFPLFQVAAFGDTFEDWDRVMD